MYFLGTDVEAVGSDVSSIIAASHAVIGNEVDANLSACMQSSDFTLIGESFTAG